MEFIVVFDGRQELLDDYSRPSTLCRLVVDPIDAHGNTRGKQRKVSAAMIRRARKELREQGA